MNFIQKLMLTAGIALLYLTISSVKLAAQVDSLNLKFDDMRKYLEKGRWLAGGTLSLEFKNSNDKDQLIRYVDESKNYEFVVRIDGAYAFANYNFAGMALQYGQAGRSGTYQNSDGEMYTEDFFGTQYSFTPFLKNMTPVDKKGRFNIITQIELLNQLGQGITQTIENEELTRRQSVKYTGLLGIRPGISVFVLRNVAFETTLNVAGLRYSHEKIKTTGLPDSVTETVSVDLKIDLLQLNMGIFVYL